MIAEDSRNAITIGVLLRPLEFISCILWKEQMKTAQLTIWGCCYRTVTALVV
jgi:hypothetical protein